MSIKKPGVFTMVSSSLGVVWLGAIVLSALSLLEAQAATMPNIVVIMTDDQTLEQMRVLTKTRQLIADQGTTFRNNYVSFPLCCPSRATFLTGQYPHTMVFSPMCRPTGVIPSLTTTIHFPFGYRTQVISPVISANI